MKYLSMMYLGFIALLIAISCNSKQQEPTSGVSEISFARSISNGSKIVIPQANGDTMIITYTPSTYTPSVLDTVIKRKVSTTTPVPPVEPPPAEGYTLTYSSGYDNAKDLDPDSHGQLGNGSLSTTTYVTGPGSFKSVPENVSSGYRAEVQYDGSRTPVEGATEFDVMFENYSPYGWGGSCVQWHPNNNNSANVFMYCSEGRFTVARNLGGSNMFQGGSTTGGTVRIESKRWYRIRFEIKWSQKADGYVKTYIDGVLNYSFTGVTQDGSGIPYLKIGQNNWGNSKGTVMYFDNLKVYKKS